jgi:hypothetical protein
MKDDTSVIAFRQPESIEVAVRRARDNLGDPTQERRPRTQEASRDFALNRATYHPAWSNDRESRPLRGRRCISFGPLGLGRLAA